MVAQNRRVRASIAAPFCQNIPMILHHIKPEQFSQLEELFGKETDSGLEIPPWLVRLKETAMTPPSDKDFEPTAPQASEFRD
jgi:hypothetical protein